MKAFLDTSSLIKLYHQEEGSEQLQDLLSIDVERIYLSELAKLEFRSAFWRKVRMNELTEEVISEVISLFEKDQEKYGWIKISHEILKKSSDLIVNYGKEGLRTLDSLQLSCAIILRDDDCGFFTSDELLKSFFEKEQLNVIHYE
jgi:predicted nucleic acid-binding protein